VLGGSDSLTVAARSDRSRAYLVIVGTALAVIALDHLTKWLVVQHLPVDSQLFPSSPVSITHVHNRGAAFGLFPQFQWLYLAAAIVVGVYILIAGHRFGTTGIRQMLLGLILGGAVSNGVDRLVQGYVVDFIDLHRWPVFNVADMSIVIGILLALLLTLMPRRADASPAA
jgi:signal peptidase II